MPSPRRLFLTLAAAAALGGCGNAASNDLPGATPLDCIAASKTYRIDHVQVPTATQASTEAFDLDGDGTLDNMAGSVIAAVIEIYADLTPALQTHWDARLGTDVAWPITVAQCDDGRARISLTGGGTGPDVPAAATVQGARVTGTDGIGAAPLGMLADLGGTGANAWVPIYPGSFDLQVQGDQLTGVIGGGFGPGYVDVVAASFLPYLQAKLDAGDTQWGASVDSNHDGTITIAELEASSYFVGLMTPDLDVMSGPLDPPARPRPDGTRESLSFGFQVHATRVP